MKQPKYSDEFKADAVRWVRERGFAQTARGLGVRETDLRRWVHADELGQADKQRILDEPSWANTQAEIEKLQSELARLLGHATALSNRTKSLTDIVTARDALRRLRAEVQVVFVHFSDDSAHARMAGERQGSLAKSPDVRPPITGRAGNFVSAPADRAGPQGASPGTQVATGVDPV